MKHVLKNFCFTGLKCRMKTIGFIIASLSLNLHASFPSDESARILYLMHQGQIDRALTYYLNFSEQEGCQDFELLQKAAVLLMEQGSLSRDSDTQLLCLLGAGISNHPQLLKILEKGIRSKELKIQLAALHFLSKSHDDEADSLLFSALSSPFLLVRFEAIYQLAKKNFPQCLEHAQSLWVKVPEKVRPLFPQIVAMMETPAAQNFMRHFLSDTDLLVRMAAILESTEHRLVDLVPHIRSLASHPEHAEQETCAYALGEFRDEASLPLLKKMMQSKREHVRLAASYALYQIGEKEYENDIEAIAKTNDFAFSLLGKEASSREFLIECLKETSGERRLNAALALLEQRDAACLPILKDILIRDERDLGFEKQLSPGKALTTWKVIPYAKAHAKTHPLLESETSSFRHAVLRKCLELPEEDFLRIAKMIFEEKQGELIPMLISLLCNQPTESCIQLLKEQQQRAGAPLIRNYCNLALFKLGEEGPYEQNLIRWVQETQNHPLITLKESVSNERSPFLFSQEETSQLLIESFETLAIQQNIKGIDALVRAIAYGNPKNRYALAGLLMRTAE
jgi:HEAT repeat protein